MFTLRPDQLDAFETSARLAFVDEMAAHVQAFSPDLCKTLEPGALRRFVVDGIARAAGYGLTYRDPIRLFLELCLILGSGFDEDPQYPWAGETLGRDDFLNQMFKAGRLEHLAREYVTRVQGPDSELAHQALMTLEALADRDEAVFHQATLRHDILASMRSIFPSKLAYVGPAAAGALIDRAETLASRLFGADEPRAVAVLSILMFSFGVKCTEDPLYPWIAATLQNPRSTDAKSRAARLERRAVIWLKAVNAGAVARMT